MNTLKPIKTLTTFNNSLKILIILAKHHWIEGWGKRKTKLKIPCCAQSKLAVTQLNLPCTLCVAASRLTLC